MIRKQSDADREHQAMKRLYDIQTSNKPVGTGSIGGGSVQQQMLTEEQKKILAANMQKNDMNSFINMIKEAVGSSMKILSISVTWILPLTLLCIMNLIIISSRI